MALSNMTIVSDGNLEFVSISFNYLDRSEINVYFDSVPSSTWAWVGDTNQIKFTPKVPNGVTVLIARMTDASDLRHVFSEGAAFTAKTLDEDLRQVLHIVQEARETNLSGNFYSDIDMHDNKVTNLAPGSNPSDAVTFQQLQDLSPDAGLREELAKDYLNTGSGLVGFRQDGTGAIGRSVESKLRDTVSVGDFGAVGDGITDDTDAFTHLELSITGRDIDLHGKTYKVSTIPIGNHYYGGTWVLPTGNSRARWEGAQLTGAGRVAFGDGALEALPIDYSVGSTGAVIAIGYKAMSKMTQAKKSIAIGPNAQENSLISRDNIAIGDSALKNVQSVTPDYSQTYQEGTRNVGIGGNAGYFITSGVRNTVIGRNAGQCATSDRDLTVYGAYAYEGYAPIGLSGEIENWAPSVLQPGELNSSTAIGSSALRRGITGYCVAIGNRSLENNKKSNGNIAIGIDTLRQLDSGTWMNGGSLTELGIDGTYTQVGTTLTLNVVGHTLNPGDIAIFQLLDGDSQTFQNDWVPAYVDTVVSPDTITIVHPRSINSSGTCRLHQKASAVQMPKNEFNTALGILCANNLKTGESNTLAGYRSASAATHAIYSTSLGARALLNLTTAEMCTAIGYTALTTMVDGSAADGIGINRTGLGYNTRVSGDNQVQLGNAGTTTYVFGTVQNRSDIRDKTDIRDTQLGLNFINRLRPVDYKWDMRDDYFEKDESGDFKTDDQGNLIPLPKDGSKARSRYHHGLIAQEVQAVIEETGLDFGGFQDHKVNGGCDVMTIGYDELIGPLIKAVQELHKIIGDLQADVASLQNRVQDLENSL